MSPYLDITRQSKNLRKMLLPSYVCVVYNRCEILVNVVLKNGVRIHSENENL